ncbi:MAG: hypothetical protein HUU25_07945 [Candidatus Sumerlaeia bacterium]|nr:hypothetical protein [Candidatus Sumerlaeia bacterium]
MTSSPLFTSVRDLVYLFFAYGRVLAITFLAVVIPGIVFTCTMTPIYEAKVKILVETETRQTSPLGDESPVPRPTVPENEMQIVISSDVLTRVVNSLNLLDPENGYWAANARHRRLPARAIATVKARIRDAIGMIRDLLPRGEGGGLTPEQLRQLEVQAIVFAMQSAIELVPVQNSQTFEILFSANDPVLCARVANEIADQYAAFRQELDRQTLTGAQEGLRQQVDRVEAQIASFEQRLLAVQSAAPGVDPSGLLADAVQQLATLESSVRENETVLAGVQQVLASGEVPQYIVAQMSTEANPALRALYEQQGQAVLELLDAELNYVEGSQPLRAARERLASINAQIESESTTIGGLETQQINPVWQDLQQRQQTLSVELLGQRAALEALGRRVEVLREQKIAWDEAQTVIANLGDQIQTLRNQRAQLESNAMAAGLGQLAGAARTTIQIFERPEPPPKPSKPVVAVNVLLSMILGMGLGLSVVSVMVYFDHSVRSVDGVEQEFGLPVVATLPDISEITGQRTVGLMSPQELTSRGLIHVYRGATERLSQGAGGTAKPKVYLVASPNSGEGTTSVLAQTASLLAQEQGLRVVAIDCRHRREAGGLRLHEIFGGDVSPGLMEVDVETASLDALVRPTRVPNLRHVTVGKATDDIIPAKLAKAVQTLTARLAGEADIVLIDTPPITEYADHLALAASADGSLLVVEFGKTRRETVQRALSSLHTAAPAVGLVLNKRQRIIPDWLYRHL